MSSIISKEFKLEDSDNSAHVVDALTVPSAIEESATFTAITWNIEGAARNFFNLKYYIDIHQPDLVFLAEPQMYSNDLGLTMQPLSSLYSASLNSGDKYDPELPLVRSKAHGGTLVLWKKMHDPHITVWPVSSPSFLPVLFQPPGFVLSVHVAIYLPTAGKDAEFLNEL